MSEEQLARLDAYAERKGLSRSAAILKAVEEAEAAPTLAEIRRAMALGQFDRALEKTGTQEVTVRGDELVKGNDPIVAAQGFAFVESKRRQAPPAEVRPKAPALAAGERVVEAVDPYDL